jgi:murein L,D-transpeptidase YcbB/YkuD
MRILRSLPFIILAVMAPLAQVSNAWSTPLEAPQSDLFVQAIQNALAHPSAPLNLYRLDLSMLRRFYQSRNYLPAWSQDAAAKRNADLALKMLEHADDDGLAPADYRLDAIHFRQKSSAPAAAAEFDLLLTANILSYMHDLRIGRVSPPEVDRDIALPSVAFDTVAALSDTLARSGMQGMNAETAPPHQEYQYLKTALASYRDMERNGGWQQVGDAPVKNLVADDQRFSLLRARLVAENFLLVGQPAEDPVAELTEALKRYQARNGIEATGVLGNQTLASLNTPVTQRISQIIANMERWRWIPHSFEETYIEANAASATLKVVDRGKVVLTSRIITGKPKTPTPIFAATVTAVTVNPYWNIPNSIARNEILPKERRKPGYMASQHIGFDGPDGGLRQQPGEDNALGRVKLEMPNRFNSYLHDTPSRSLFARNERHLSHGCMRVEQILPLASWVLTGDASAALDKIAAAIASNNNKKITLDRPLPVYVLYWTVVADRDGRVETSPDVYGRDRKLLAVLAGQRLIGMMASNKNCPAVKAG